MYRNDDFVMNGEGVDATATPTKVKVPQFACEDEYAIRELMRIVALTKKHNLQNKPEVLAGMLDELSASLKQGDFLKVLKHPAVYGGIAVLLSAVIIWKLSQRKKRK